MAVGDPWNFKDKPHPYDSYQNCDDESHIHKHRTTEDAIRAKIAEQIRYELMPLCVCADCGNELEGRLIQQVLDIILNCKKGQ